MERRAFVKRLAAGLGAGALVAGPGEAAARSIRVLADDLKKAPDGRAFWRRVRSEFLLNPGVVHLNTGSLGATPRPVIDAVCASMLELEGDPVSNEFGAMGNRMEAVRAGASRFLGAAPDEVVLTQNTTEGMNAIATGLDLRPGDEVLTTDHEHPGGMIGWQYLAEHRGAKVVTIRMPAPVRDEAQVLQLVEDHLTPRTRVCSFSHVETITGLRMPMAAIAGIVRPREILLVCDGAQAPGMLKVDVKALGVDAYASSSHKWMLAPKGSGLLYIRKEVQPRIRPVLLASGYQAYSASSGTRDVPHILGHGVAMEFHEAIGRERVEARCVELNRYLRRRLGAISSLRPLTPEPEGLSSGIASFGLSRGRAAEIYERLHHEHDVVVKVVARPEYNALRLSTHIYNTEGEIDRTADLIEGMLKG